MKRIVKAIIFAITCWVILFLGSFLGTTTFYFTFLLITFSIITILTCILPLVCAKYLFKYKLNTLSVLISISISILVMTHSFYSGFKDNFCWSKAHASTYDWQKVATDLTQNEREYIKKVYDIDSPTVYLVAYMRCDKNFKFIEAFKEVYLEN